MSGLGWDGRGEAARARGVDFEINQPSIYNPPDPRLRNRNDNVLGAGTV